MLVDVQVILILIDMHQGVRHCRHRVIQGRQRRVLYVRRHVLDDEERHQRVPQFRFTATFRAKEIQDRKRACGACHYVTEQRSEVEYEAHTSVIPEYLEDLLRKLRERQLRVPDMNEATLKLEQLDVVAVNLRVRREVEIPLILDAHDAEVIHLQEVSVVEDAIAKGKEPLPLPS